MEGSWFERSYVVADVAEDDVAPRCPERVFHYRHPGVGGRNVLLSPFAGGWRADLQLRPDDDPAASLQRRRRGPPLGRQGAAALLRRPGDMGFLTYRFLQVVATVHRRQPPGPAGR